MQRKSEHYCHGPGPILPEPQAQVESIWSPPRRHTRTPPPTIWTGPHHLASRHANRAHTPTHTFSLTPALARVTRTRARTHTVFTIGALSHAQPELSRFAPLQLGTEDAGSDDRCTSARLAALSARSCLVKPGPSTRGLLSHYITSLIVLLARGFGILHALCLDFPLPGRQRRAGLRIVVRQRTTGSYFSFL